MDKLAQNVVEECMARLPEWSLSGDSIQRTFTFDDFNAAIGFVNSLAEMAESMNHHPDILIRWNKVTLTLSTHDAGGLTSRDFDLAGRIDESTAG
ncbi:MAG: 4a-hydroxytetrahydrobiopterin dehydratase [Phycisphaerae bacterium]|nr:4a-hydroxytetrahydrobiopterin dehydratase [Phycisphaerae bacterium]